MDTVKPTDYPSIPPLAGWMDTRYPPAAEAGLKKSGAQFLEK